MHHLLLCFHSVVFSTELMTLLAIISGMYSLEVQVYSYRNNMDS